MASRFSLSGWRTATISPRPVAPTPIAPATPLPNIATAGYTAGNLARTPGRLNDPTLASRAYGSTVPGTVKPAFAESVYQRPNVPAYLAQAVTDLNTGQSLQRSLQQEWNNKILGLASGGGPNGYLYQEALRAASVSPGAHVSFGAAVQNPDIGTGYLQAAQGQKAQALATAGAIAAPQNYQTQIAALQKERQQLGANAFGMYSGSRQKMIDDQLFNLQGLLAGANQVAAGQNKSSGWTPNMLPY